jgi:hypothetical protein
MTKKLNVEHMKPTKFRHYLTLGELSLATGKSPGWIRTLERRGRIPEAVRHRLHGQEIRLYPPGRVEEIKRFFANQRPGRPRGS